MIHMTMYLKNTSIPWQKTSDAYCHWRPAQQRQTEKTRKKVFSRNMKQWKASCFPVTVTLMVMSSHDIM